MKYQKLRLCSKSKQRLRAVPILLLSILILGCQAKNDTPYQSNVKAIRMLKNAEIPVFPKPSKECGEEIKKFATPETCPYFYQWLGKLMIFEKQLGVLKNEVSTTN